MAVSQSILDERRSSLMDLLSFVSCGFRRVGALTRSDKESIFNLTHTSSDEISGEKNLSVYVITDEDVPAICSNWRWIQGSVHEKKANVLPRWRNYIFGLLVLS
ncbi:unnamed protein product [Eruca vesicaria subsp. sativa]|uniref:Uncharacterized protein n=1 Tax=Eruca vesicaria subsp. sativa TaxID=29727 RepID=A0ABC8K7F0_ERUVS|nr:unnamed protein product [Eruca vesicaria subsp. sativa]